MCEKCNCDFTSTACLQHVCDPCATFMDRLICGRSVATIDTYLFLRQTLSIAYF